MTTTIQRTSKKLKFLQLISFLLVIIGFLGGIAHPGLFLLIPIAFVLAVITKFLIWWNHS